MSATATYKDAYRGRRVCVTGGAGFIGSHLCDALVKFGAHVSVIDDLSSGRMENLAQHGDRVRLVEGSILDERLLRDAVAKAEIIFHEAALCSVPRSVEEPALYHEVNATGTLRVLEAARQVGAKRVVFAASSSAYGDAPAQPKIETMPPDCLSPYAATKLMGEQLVRVYANCYEISGISLRYFNIFGPRQRPDSPYAAVIPKFAEAMLAGRAPTVHGDGSQTRDFTHVANAVHANLLAGASTATLAGQIVNIACGQSFSLIQLIQTMAKLLGIEPTYEKSPPRLGDVQHSRADITAARKLLGYDPITGFEAGLKQTIDQFQPAA